MAEPNRRTMLILFATLFCVMTGFGIIIPALPFYTLKLHGDSRMVGLLMASYSAMNFAFAPFWGRLSDRIGRKPVLICGILGLAVSFVVFGLAQTSTILFASRMVGGAFGAAALPTAMAYAGDLATDLTRGSLFGMLGAGIGLGMVVGPALGGVLGHYGEHIPFFAAAGISLLTAGFVAFALPPGAPRPAQRMGMLEGFRQTGQQLWAYYLLTFLQMMAFASMEATFVLYGKDKFNLGMMEIGLMFMAMGLVSAGFQGGGVGKLIRRYGDAVITRAGCVVLAVGFACVPLAGNLFQLFLAFCCFGIGSALLRTSISTGVSRGATVGQGVAMGLQQSCEALARVFGPVIGGFLYFMGPAIPYQVGAGLMVAATVLGFLALHAAAPAPLAERS